MTGDRVTDAMLHEFEFSAETERKFTAWAALGALASGTAASTVELLYGMTPADLAPYEEEWNHLQRPTDG